MKKFLSLLLAAMMLLGCLSAMAEGAADWKINKTTQLVARKSAAEKVDHIVVPAEVDGLAVRGLEYMCFNMYKNFKQLTLPGSAVMLDRSTTRDLPNLETVELGDSLIVIREGNFTNLPKLTSVVLPASVALVHSSFNKCASLTSITFEGVCPIFVAEGSYGLFTELPAACVIYVPDDQVDAYKAALADREDVVARIQPSGRNAERIDRPATESGFAFDASTGTITSYTGTADYLVIPTTIDGVQVKHIADFAFETNVCCIIIPEGVETIGRYSLGHELLTYVSLPSTLTNVGSGAVSSSYLSAISYPAAIVPAYEAAAFEGVKGDAWQLILPYGTTQEQVDAFAAYMAPSAPKAVVKSSIIEPYSFPALDAEAGAPFIGTWNAVAVTDGTDFYGMDLLGISVAANLQADGTGVVDLDGDAAPGGWYVEDGTAIFAPILEEGGQPVPEEAMPFSMDENGRMCLDLGGLILLMELEGAVYATPVIPERPWPEFSLDNAQAFVGTWEATSYEVEGETYPAELLGVMVLTLNNDGTALMTEPGEEPYALQWYADYGIAYVGPAMSDLAEITFDGNGSIEMVQDGMTVILAPYVEAYVIQGADELLGDWYDDVGNKLTLVNDGTLTHTYSFDGWVDTYAWDVVNGAAVVTEGPWSGLPITLENGILIITNDEGIFQIFSRDGDLSAYYGEDDEDYDMPEAQPIGAEGEPYFGAWNGEMFGMEVILTLNPDGTCAMEMMGEAEPGVWSIVDGKANIMGDELYIDGDGNLVMPSMDMVFVKVGGAQAVPAPSLPEVLEGYVGTWHLCYAATGGLTGDLRSMGLTGMLVLHADGTGVMTGLSEEIGSWYDDEGQVRFGESGMPIFLLEDGFLRYGTELSGYMVFSQDEAAVWTPAAAATPAPTAAPTAAPQAPVTGDVAHLNTRFVCRTYTSAGYTMDASMLGAEYALVFHDNGTADFTMAGFTAANLPYTVTAEGVYAINYYGTMFNCTPTASGFDMDFYGTMMMHFVPAE